MARLIVSRGDVLHCEYELGGNDITVGSDSSDDVVLADAGVAGRHAELRFQEGQYVIYDLGSESGVCVNGQRVSQAVLAPGVVVAVGPFRARVDLQPRANPAAADAPTLYAGQPPQPPRTDATRPVREEPASRPAAAPAVARAQTDTKARQAPAQVSLVARIARLPKPVLFGGVSFLLILILALRVLTAPTADVSRTAATASTGEPKVTAPDNKQTIAAHLESGRARNQRGEYAEAIREDFEPILLIDKTNADALALKAEADEGLKKPTSPEPSRPEALAGTESVATDSAPLPGRAGATPRPREAAAVGRARTDALLPLYNQATTAIRVEDYSTAAKALASIVREDPRYRDAAKRLEEVWQAQAERAKVAFDAAMVLEQDEELIKARSALERACTMPQPPSACAEASKRLAEKIQNAGTEAFRRARLFDGQGRLPEAIALYERAVQFLAADDANRPIAKERLELLKSRR